jgi:GT2 family glycosyltransferase
VRRNTETVSMDKSTCVIIINFNAGDALLRSVASVLNLQEPLRLIVADNNSNDGSCEKLKQRYTDDSRLLVIENKENIGFSRAVNACARQCNEPFMLVLNPDCELSPGAFVELRSALIEDDRAALAAPMVTDHDGQVQSGTYRTFPRPWKSVMTGSGLSRFSQKLPGLKGVDFSAGSLPEDTCQAEAVSGACLMMKTPLFLSSGGYDEAYEMHFEDLDLMYRFHGQGNHVLYVPSAKAIHVAGLSSRSRPWWVHFQKHRGMQRFYHKNYSSQYKLFSRLVLYLGIWSHYVLSLPLVLVRR